MKLLANNFNIRSALGNGYLWALSRIQMAWNYEQESWQVLARCISNYASQLQELTPLLFVKKGVMKTPNKIVPQFIGNIIWFRNQIS